MYLCVKENPLINLPTRETSKISNTRDDLLRNNMELKNVLYIPFFKHNVLSINKLCQNMKCKTEFCYNYCIIQDTETYR